MKFLLHGMNFAPEEIGTGKYSGEMVAFLAAQGCDVTVVTTHPYYPHWKSTKATGFQLTIDPCGDCKAGTVRIIRCPSWVPKEVNGWKRVIHLATYGLSSIPPVLWKALWWRPDVIMTIEPAAFCMPTTWLAARLCHAKAWLHVQDFEVDAAFELGILKQPVLKKIVLAVEAFLMRRFDRVSSISPNMVGRLRHKGVAAACTRLFPNWVDCDVMRPLNESENENSDLVDREVDQWDVAEARRSFGIPTSKCVALYAGNIGAKQGLELIVEAARICHGNSNLHFVICGNGAKHAALAAEAQGLENLQMLPLQPVEVFNELMNCADIHMLPQKGNAADLVMPSKLTGMLATGRPVVACASPGTQIADVVKGCGWVVPPGDAKAFASALGTLASDDEHRRRLGLAARRYAVAHLSRPAILQRFYADLCELLGKESQAATGCRPVDMSTDSSVARPSVARSK